MSKADTNTVARVQLTIELHVGNWGPDCQLGQVYDQAKHEATNRLHRVLGPHGFKIVGDRPRILAITTERGNRECEEATKEPQEAYRLEAYNSAGFAGLGEEWVAEILVNEGTQASLMVHGKTQEEAESLRQFIVDRCSAS